MAYGVVVAVVPVVIVIVVQTHSHVQKQSSEVDDPLIILWLGLFFYVSAYFSPNWLKLI